MQLGVHGLTILGVLGEAAKLSVDERSLVTKTVFETVKGRVPVVVGCSHPNVETSIRLGREAVEAGSVAIMLHPPRFDKSAISNIDDEVFNFYARIAAEVDSDIVIQDLPTANEIVMSAELLARIAENIARCKYLKLEDPPLMIKVSAVKAKTNKLKVFGGLGGMFFLEEMKRGADGTMTGFAFSEVLVAVYEQFIAGHTQKAEEIFDKYLPLIRFENQPVVNLSIRKVLLQKRGAIDCPVLRSPFVPIDEGTQQEIDWMLARCGISEPKQRLSLA